MLALLTTGSIKSPPDLPLYSTREECEASVELLKPKYEQILGDNGKLLMYCAPVVSVVPVGKQWNS